MDKLKQYAPLVLLKGDPLELPSSINFFKYNLIVYYCAELFMQANMIDPWEAFQEVTIETILTLAFVALMMFLNRNLEYYLPIATAFLICENIIAIAGMPVMVWLTVTDSVASYITFATLMLWDIVLVTYIIKHVLKVDAIAALAVSCLYFVTTYGGAYGLAFLV